MAAVASLLMRAAMATTRGATAVARTAGGQYLSALGQSAIQSTLYPTTRELGYHLNQISSNVVPDVPSILTAYYAGRMTDVQTRTLLGYQGVDWQFAAPVGAGTYTVQAWKHIVDVNRPRMGQGDFTALWQQGYVTDVGFRNRCELLGLPREDVELLLTQTMSLDIGTAIGFRNQGILDDVGLREQLRRAGFTDPAMQDRFLTQREPLALQDVRRLFYIYGVPEDEAAKLLARLGFTETLDFSKLVKGDQPLPPAEALQLLYRGGLDADLVKQHIKLAIGDDKLPAADYIKAMRPMPGPADLVTFSVRDVWQPDVVAQFGYDDEFPAQFAFYMGQQGLDWTPDLPLGQPGLGQAASWPKAYWRAHWQLISPSQAYEAFHRLRPGREQRYAGQIPDVHAFTYDDLRTLLKTADYPPTMRSWLAAVSFAPLRLSDIRNAYFSGIIELREVKELFRDRGQSEADASVSAQLVDKQRFDKVNAIPIAVAKAAAREAYAHLVASLEAGVVGREQFIALVTGPGLPENMAILMADNVDSKIAHKQLLAFLAMTKRDYLEGVLSATQALAQVVSYGVQGPRATAYLQEWSVERSLQQKTLATGQIVSAVAHGYMPYGVGLLRLTNLGWVNGDAIIMLASAQAALASAESKALQQAEKSRAAKARALEAEQKKLQDAIKKAAADLKKLTPVSTLKAWFIDGVVSAEYISNRLSAMLYPRDVIDGYVADWLPQREAKANAKGKQKGSTAGG